MLKDGNTLVSERSSYESQLTSVFNVEWQPEKECVVDELREEQTERELNYAGDLQSSCEPDW